MDIRDPEDLTAPHAHLNALTQSPGDPVAEVRVIELPVHSDERGSLTVGQYGDHIPFVPLRYYAIFDVPEERVRGGHAHSRFHSFLVCLKGACSITLDNGRTKQTYRLDTPRKGLYVPPRHFNRLFDFSRDAVLLCLSSGKYDRAEYILNYDDFVRSLKNT